MNNALMTGRLAQMAHVQIDVLTGNVMTASMVNVGMLNHMETVDWIQIVKIQIGAVLAGNAQTDAGMLNVLHIINVQMGSVSLFGLAAQLLTD